MTKAQKQQWNVYHATKEYFERQVKEYEAGKFAGNKIPYLGANYTLVEAKAIIEEMKMEINDLAENIKVKL